MSYMSLFLFGIVATLPMGPAGFNVANSCVATKSFPKNAFLGFVAGEFIYLALAWFLKDLFSANIQFWSVFTGIITSVFIFSYGIYSIQNQKKNQMKISEASGFKKSLLITLSNPSILILHLGILLQVQKLQLSIQFQMVASFLLGGLVAILAIILVLLLKKEFFYKNKKNIELVSGYFLLIIGAVIFKNVLQNIVAL